MKFFKAYELVDRKTYETLGDKAIELFTPEILEALDGVREFFDEPILVNNWHSGGEYQWRGYRTPEKAKQLGSEFSQHAWSEVASEHNGTEWKIVNGKQKLVPLCNAFDFDVRNMSANEVRQVIRLNKDDPLLSRIMRMEDRVGWVHIDCKPVTKRIYLFHA